MPPSGRLSQDLRALMQNWVNCGSQEKNIPPQVNAGPDQTITLPAAATLTGTASDQLCTPSLTITWSRFSGPPTVTFANPNVASTTATFSAAGSYVLRLTANDGSLSASDDVAITVQAAF